MNFFTRRLVYPQITITHIKNPNRFYAIPLLGFLIKMIILLPIFIELAFLALAYVVVTFINSFYVLFTGKYWDVAYTFGISLMRLGTKIFFFITGLTNSYPGFDFTIRDGYEIVIEKPVRPNRLFAIPLLGGLVRIVFLIPLYVWSSVVQSGAEAGILFSSFCVLFNGTYPESIYEVTKDYQRLSLATACYFLGFSDQYPNFAISMNHKNIKITLIVIGILLNLSNWVSSNHRPTSYPRYIPQSPIARPPSLQYTPKTY